MTRQNNIVYTITDEAPALATASLLPIIRYFAHSANINIESTDLSLAGRIIANFPESLTEEQRQVDALEELGKLVNQPHANIIKLPNISASIPQLQAAITELQSQGYNIPDYPEDPKNEDEISTQAQYKKVLGSAVNPVLRQGNADRRPIPAAKAYAQSHPHKMGAWDQNSPSHVAHMMGGDFYANEKSTTVVSAQNARIEFIAENGSIDVLNKNIPLQESEVVDATFMSVKALRNFIKEQMKEAKDQNILFSVHLKATMMKISDPEIFGHVVEVFLEDVFEKYGDLFEKLGINANNGIGDIEAKISELPQNKQDEINAAIKAALDNGPDLMMVDAEKNITNLHRPNDVIIDASMPPIIRWSGKTTGPDGKEHDVKAVIPDSTYAVFHKAMINEARSNGTFNPATMGSVKNIGLMAQKAEEYGSHDKTYMAKGAGIIRVIGEDNKIIHQHEIEKGDIWRMCQAKDSPIKNWIELTVERTRITDTPTIFWLDKNRPHDAQLILKVEEHLKTLGIEDLEIHIMAPEDATKYTNKIVREGKNVNAATGNVLRDHLTDMYPILELGTSAKMLSIVPEMAGGAMFETGAGGSAPKHVEQVLEEGHLRWDSLGEFAAIAASFEELGRKQDNDKALILSTTLDQATTRLLNEGKSPSRVVGELDSKGSQFYLAKYWAKELVDQDDDLELQAYFTLLSETLSKNENKILEELSKNEGSKTDLGGYYHPNPEKLSAIMRPSKTLNEALAIRE